MRNCHTAPQCISQPSSHPCTAPRPHVNPTTSSRVASPSVSQPTSQPPQADSQSVGRSLSCSKFSCSFASTPSSAVTPSLPPAFPQRTPTNICTQVRLCSDSVRFAMLVRGRDRCRRGSTFVYTDVPAVGRCRCVAASTVCRGTVAGLTHARTHARSKTVWTAR